jgi:hypothetical protein
MNNLLLLVALILWAGFILGVGLFIVGGPDLLIQSTMAGLLGFLFLGIGIFRTIGKETA